MKFKLLEFKNCSFSNGLFILLFDHNLYPSIKIIDIINIIRNITIIIIAISSII